MINLNEEKKYIKLILGITCLSFFLICIFSIFKYGNATLLGNLTTPDNDDVKFIRSAWTLVETGKYIYHDPSMPTVFMMPGLPFTLAFFVMIFGKFGGITAFRIFQAMIQTGSLFILFLIARKIFNSKVGAISVIISALCIADYWVTNLILTESIFKFFVLSLVYFSIYAVEEKKTKYYVLGGIFLGVGTLFRPTIATFPIVILFMWILKKYSIKDMIKYTVLVGGIFCIILSPWWIRNYNVFHKFIPLTLATGNPMLQGTYINYDQTSAKTDGLNYTQFKYPAGSEMANNKVEMEISKYRLKNLVPKQPLKFLYWYTIGKATRMIRWPFIWVQFLGVRFWMAGLWHYLILATGLLGAIKYYRNKERNTMGTIVVATIIYFLVVYLPFYAFERYFYPAIPFVIILAAYGVINIADRVVKKPQLHIK